MLAQITINKGQGVLTQITRNKFSSMEGQRIFFWCGLTKITINKGKAVLAQITRNIFLYERTRTKMCFVLAQITINKEKVWGTRVVVIESPTMKRTTIAYTENYNCSTQ